MHDPSTACSLRLECPLPGDQLPMPPEDGVGGHDGRDLPQDPRTESATLGREAAALVIGQPLPGVGKRVRDPSRVSGQYGLAVLRAHQLALNGP